MRRAVRRLGLARWIEPYGRNLDNYKAEFPASAEAFLDFLGRCPTLPSPDARQGTAGIAIIPWFSTPTPWYAISLAIGLRLRGRNIDLIWDDTAFAWPNDATRLEQKLIGRVLDAVGQYLPVIRLSAEDLGPARPGDTTLSERLAQMNWTWWTRAAVAAEGDEQHTGDIANGILRSLRHMRGLLARKSYDYLVVSGGVVSTSCAFVAAAAEAGIRAATYDANLGVLQVAVDGIAAQQSDLPRAFAELMKAPAEERARHVQVARRALRQRASARDRAAYQMIAHSGAQPSTVAHVLLPLNVEFDTAALGRHHIFANSIEWVTETAAYVLAHSEAQITVRQHPSERRKLERGRSDLQAVLAERFGDQKRIRFVQANEPVNTYDLLDEATVVLPFVSTIGVEAAALGKPVLAAGLSYYAELGLAWLPLTRAEYFELLSQSLAGQLSLRENQVERAWLCYYLSPVCNRVWTAYTAQPPDFWRWCHRSPARLYRDPAVSDVLEAIDTNVPLSLVRHRRRSSFGARQ